jgi:hypothetical protein
LTTSSGLERISRCTQAVNIIVLSELRGGEAALVLVDVFNLEVVGEIVQLRALELV